MNLTLPTDFVPTVASNTTAMIASVKTPAALIIGVLLAFLVITLIISALTKNDTEYTME